MIHNAQSSGGLAIAERPAAPTAEPIDALTGVDEEFALDVKVLVTLAPVGTADCPTDDGCGNTCAGSASSCNSSMNAL